MQPSCEGRALLLLERPPRAPPRAPPPQLHDLDYLLVDGGMEFRLGLAGQLMRREATVTATEARIREHFGPGAGGGGGAGGGAGGGGEDDEEEEEEEDPFEGAWARSAGP